MPTNLTLNDITKSIKLCKKDVNISLNISDTFIQPSVIPSKVGDYNAPEITTNTSNKLDYSEGNVIDFPDFLSSKIDLNSYYIYGVKKPRSLYESVIYIIDTNFKLEEETKQTMFVDDLKSLLLEEYEKIFKQNSYSKLGFKKPAIRNAIENDIFGDMLLNLICDYFKINIFLINLENETSKLVSQNESENIITLLFHDNTYLPVVSIYGSDPYVLYPQIKNKFD
jgi:hypothetical protein